MSAGTRTLTLGIDGGQTSTKAILVEPDGTVVGTGTGSPCDHLHGPNGYAKNRDAIASAAAAALAAAQRPASDIRAAGLGLTSAPREMGADATFRRMVDEFATIDPDAFWVDADFVSNLAGASAGGPGIVVIAGGGSIGYGVDDSGREAIAGGLGYLMGDEGSGWYIGLHAIQAAARAYDLRGPQTALLPFVLDHYGLSQIRDIIRIIYAEGFSRDRISSIARDVIRIAGDGDPVAAEIVRTGAERLGDTALGVARQLHAAGDPIVVYPTGGVLSARPLVRDPFAARIRSLWPEATIADPAFPPVVGAVLQVWKTTGEPITAERLARIAETLP
ncbi:MAG TPA: BadF/BadG/BcrA/BcrD ATPase family protein [Thermomicrobiales bacterium]|nr:BadF/BadG/BcrA/BcrD ATPase family protein [Thermomicrobiales bacterium]